MPHAKLHVGLLSGTLPVLFGPYATQLVLLANEFQRHGHTVSWVSVNGNAATAYIPPEYNVTVRPLTNPGPVYVSTINDFCKSHAIDSIISLLDLGRIFADESFAMPSFAWFPTHFIEQASSHGNRPPLSETPSLT